MKIRVTVKRKKTNPPIPHPELDHYATMFGGELKVCDTGAFFEIILDSPDDAKNHETAELICKMVLANPWYQEATYEVLEPPA